MNEYRNWRLSEYDLVSGDSGTYVMGDSCEW